MILKKIKQYLNNIYFSKKKKSLFNEIIEEAKDTRQYVKSWLIEIDSLNEIAVKVREVDEALKWQEKILTNTPETAKPFFNRTMLTEVCQQKEHIKQTLPNFEKIKYISYVPILGATAVSSSAIVGPSQNLLISLTGSKNLEINTWATDGTNQYNVLQIKLNRFDEIKSMLSSLKYDIKKEFEISEINKFNLKHPEDRIDIGFKMRNVVDELHGQMIASARAKGMIGKGWGNMSNFISIDLPGSVAYLQLINEEAMYKHLQNKLTTLGKNYNSGFSEQDIKNLYSQYIDYVYNILNLVKL